MHANSSIVFAAAYFVLLPIAIWRLAIPASRCLTLIRPAVFIALRIGTFIIRGIQANGNYQIGLFVAEQVRTLSLSALVFPCLPEGDDWHFISLNRPTFALTRSCCFVDLSSYVSLWLLYWGVISRGMLCHHPIEPPLAASWFYSEWHSRWPFFLASTLSSAPYGRISHPRGADIFHAMMLCSYRLESNLVASTLIAARTQSILSRTLGKNTPFICVVLG